MSDQYHRQASSTEYRQELQLVNYFVRRLEGKLAGREHPRLVNRLPIDECHLGVLVPWRDPEENDPLNPDEVEEVTVSAGGVSPKTTERPSSSVVGDQPPAAAGTDKQEDAEVQRGVPERRDDQDQPRRPPSSLGCELLVRPGDGAVEIEVEASFAVYTQHLPSFTEQMTSQGGNFNNRVEGDAPTQRQEQGTMTLAEVLQRNEVNTRTLRFTVRTSEASEQTDRGELQKALDKAVAEALKNNPRPLLDPSSVGKGGKAEAQLKIERKHLVTEEAFAKWLATLSSGKPPRRPNPELRASLLVRAEPQADGLVRISAYLSNETEKGRIRSEDNINILADVRLSGRVTRGTIEPVEILPIPKDYQYDRRVWGVGHNTSVEVDQAKGEFYTRALARFDQPRLTTKDRFAANFNELAEAPLRTLDPIYREMEREITHWEQDILGGNAEGLSPEELHACRNDLDHFKDEVDRFATGLAALSAEPRLMAAFKGMNRVMGRIAAQKSFTSWRLFQIAFIVTQLPALALREGVKQGAWPEGQMRVWENDTEWADVLWFPTGGGKTEAYLGLICCAMLYDRLRGKSLGLTAWLRFPLRMLSIQQLQRAMQLMWEAQKELDDLLPPSGDSSHDPLRLGYFVGSTTTPNQLGENFFKEHRTSSDCEKYKVVTDCPKCNRKRSIEVVPLPTEDALRHRCKECGQELPLVVTDTEIYRSLPALIIGTVDKMATLGLQERFGMLWSGPRWRCPTHGYGIGEYCIYGCGLDPKQVKKLPRILAKDTAPSLHLQDELHLLQEELGAFSGHYETLIRHCEEQSAGAKAKVVAATATIEGFEHQVKHLYGVIGARRFPGRGYRRHESFYAKLEADPDHEGEDKVARVFVAFKPSGNSIEAAARCSRVLNAEITRLFEDPHAVLASLSQVRDETELDTLRLFYSMTLTYVASLQGGTRVKDLLSQASKEILNNTRDLSIRYLSSRTSTSEIAEVIDEVEKPKSWESNKHIDALVATNVISHGVDLERCNLMVMERFPAGIAEYIQASSRSGRKKVGLVVVVLPNYNLRAASVYNRFKEYHVHLDRMVSPVPVNRFAKYALRRTLPGTVSGLLFGIANPVRNTIRHKGLRQVVSG